MSRREKLRSKLRQQPADASMQDVQTCCNVSGSSWFVHAAAIIFSSMLMVSFLSRSLFRFYGRRVKKIYVEKAVILLDEMFPPDTDEDENGKDA